MSNALVDVEVRGESRRGERRERGRQGERDQEILLERGKSSEL